MMATFLLQRPDWVRLCEGKKSMIGNVFKWLRIFLYCHDRRQLCAYFRLIHELRFKFIDNRNGAPIALARSFIIDYGRLRFVSTSFTNLINFISMHICDCIIVRFDLNDVLAGNI